MKNAMKKLMSLVLVAILLVSAVPFAASATTVVSIPVEIYQEVDGVEAATINATTTKLSIAEICAENGIGTGEFEGAWVTNNGKEYKKDFDGEFGATSTLVKIRKKAIVTTATCNNCNTVYKIADGHTCPEPDPVAPITIVVKVDSSDNVVWQGTKVPSNGEYALVKNLLNYCWNSSWTDVYEFSHAYRYANDGTKGQSENQDLAVYAGEEVHIMLKTKEVKETTPSTSEGTTPTNKFKWDIYLNIYVNNKVDAPAKTIKINDSIALDNTVSLEETLTIVDDYYYATDSTKGIILDGLYQGKGNWALNFVTDSGKYNSFTNLDKAREENYVFINVMATNVTAKGTYTADSSNPKTGDMIFAPIAVLGLSASALAVMFFLNKKRAV